MSIKFSTKLDLLAELVDLPKAICNDLIIKSVKQPKNSYVAEAKVIVRLSDYQEIKNLSFECVSSHQINGFWKHQFKLFHLHEPTRNKDCFMRLDIVDTFTVHSDAKKDRICGAHIHILDKAVKVEDSQTNNLNDWFDYFKSAANLELHGKLIDPVSEKQRGLL